MTVRLVQRGDYDAAFEASVGADGMWTCESGTYVTRGRRARRLTAAERARLAGLVAALPAGDPEDAPRIASGFASTLTVDGRTWHWAGPTAESAVADLVRWLAAPAG